MRLFYKIATLVSFLSIMGCTGDVHNGPYMISAVEHKETPFLSIEFRDSTGVLVHEFVYQDKRDTIATTDSTSTIKVVNHSVKNSKLLAVHKRVDETVVRNKNWDPDNPHTILEYRSEMTLFNNECDSIWSYVHIEKIDASTLRSDIQFSHPRFTRRDDLLFVLARTSKDVENGFIRIVDDRGEEQMNVSTIDGNPIHTPMMPHVSRDGKFCLLEFTDLEGKGLSNAMLVELENFKTYDWGQRLKYATLRNGSTVEFHPADIDTIYRQDMKKIFTF